MDNRTLLSQLADKVSQVRNLQKEYFRTRNKMIMQSSISAEKELDELLASIPDIKQLGITTVRTVSGIDIDIARPMVSDIDIVDIAWGLCNEPRFGGQVKVWYSVGEHSIWCAKRAPQGKKLATLLHDAPEFIMKDVAGPHKQLYPEYKYYENRLQRVIFEKFGIDKALITDPEIKTIDNLALEWEIQNVRDNAGVAFKDMEYVRGQFLTMFEYFYKNKL